MIMCGTLKTAFLAIFTMKSAAGNVGIVVVVAQSCNYLELSNFTKSLFYNLGFIFAV